MNTRSRRARRRKSTPCSRSLRVSPQKPNNQSRRPNSNPPRNTNVSQAEDPRTISRERAGEVTVEDVRKLMGASTPHFALQLRQRIVKLIAGLPAGHPARVEGEREIARLQRL